MTKYAEQPDRIQQDQLGNSEANGLNLLDITKSCGSTDKCISAVPSIYESAFGDILVSNGNKEELQLISGEALVLKNGRITTWNANGKVSDNLPTEIMSGRKPVDYGTEIYNNGVWISQMVDGSLGVLFPSGIEVSVRNGRVESVTTASGKQHRF